MRSWFKLGAVEVPVPPFATASVPPSVNVPELVMGPPVKVRPVDPPEALTEVTRPRDEVEMDDTAPFVPKRRPFKEPIESPPVVVVPVTEAETAARAPVELIVPNVPVDADNIEPVDKVVVAPELVK